MTHTELSRRLRDPVLSQEPRVQKLAADLIDGSRFARPTYDPKRHTDEIEALTEQLAFEKKRSAALLCTITRLEYEVARAARANAQLVQTVMELRNAVMTGPQAPSP
jgi:hypothetical protein